MKTLLFIVITVFTKNVCGERCACGVEGFANRIVGGVKVPNGKYPWMAQIMTGNVKNEWFDCGGAIITDRHILSAAHCFEDITKVKIGVGSNKKLKISSMLNASKIKVHERYSKKSLKNDIAIVTLLEPLNFNRTISSICLPSAKSELSGKFTVSGWGRTSNGKRGKSSNDLLETLVDYYSFDECNNDWDKGLGSGQFCASNIGHDLCQGDSGGPLMQKIGGKVYLAGVVTFGDVNCATTLRSVYTKVSAFLTWIKRNTAEGVYCK